MLSVSVFFENTTGKHITQAFLHAPYTSSHILAHTGQRKSVKYNAGMFTINTKLHVVAGLVDHTHNIEWIPVCACVSVCVCVWKGV